MKQEKVPVGVIGVGHLGRWHVQQFKNIPRAQLVGFYDNDPQRARTIQEEFSVSAFQDVNELLKQCQAVSIVTPTTTHFHYAEQALQAKNMCSLRNRLQKRWSRVRNWWR